MENKKRGKAEAKPKNIFVLISINHLWSLMKGSPRHRPTPQETVSIAQDEVLAAFRSVHALFHQIG
ncbi:MAG: hypothetical protein ABIR30_13395 [Chitinophagaceae bacterium]